MPLIDLPKPDGDNTAGLTTTIYYQLAENVLSFPATGIDMSTAAVLEGDIELTSGQVWKKIYCTLETGSVQSELVSGRDGRAWRNTLTISHPGNNPEALGFLEYVKNSRFLCIAQEIDGNHRVVGSKFLPATLKAATAGTGDAIDSKKAVQIEVEGIGPISPIYNGIIKLIALLYIAPGYIAPGYFVES